MRQKLIKQKMTWLNLIKDAWRLLLANGRFNCYLSAATERSGRNEAWKEMDYENMSDEALYQLLKTRAPEMPIHKVDYSNRNTIIAVLQITETTDGREDKLDANG